MVRNLLTTRSMIVICHPFWHLRGKRTLPGENRTILIVEDDKRSMDAMKALLRLYQYKTLEAGTVDEAVKHLYHSSRPDLILLDLKLPGRGGDEFIKEIQSNRLFRTIPIVIVSGHPEMLPSDIQVAAVFEKPIDNAILMRTIEEVLQKSHGFI